MIETHQIKVTVRLAADGQLPLMAMHVLGGVITEATAHRLNAIGNTRGEPGASMDIDIAVEVERDFDLEGHTSVTVEPIDVDHAAANHLADKAEPAFVAG